jgi:hypothetical protein
MIIAEPTKHGTGVTLFGDYWDLRSLHDTVCHLGEGPPLSENMSDFVLNLADDIEQAGEKGGETRVFGDNDHDRVTYRGVSVIWPTFLFAVGLLHWSAGFRKVSKDHQADLYRLSACVEDALTAYDPIVGKICFQWFEKFTGFSKTYSPQFVFHVALNYVSGKPGKPRFAKLPEFLQMLSPASAEYKSFIDHMAKIAKENKCVPEDIEYLVECPKFKW